MYVKLVGRGYEGDGAKFRSAIDKSLCAAVPRRSRRSGSGRNASRLGDTRDIPTAFKASPAVRPPGRAIGFRSIPSLPISFAPDVRPRAMTFKFPSDSTTLPDETAIRWLLDSDASIRWQVRRDLNLGSATEMKRSEPGSQLKASARNCSTVTSPGASPPGKSLRVNAKAAWT